MQEIIEQTTRPATALDGAKRCASSTSRPRLAAVFADLARLRDGWFEGAGKAPDKERLREVARILIDGFPENVPLPAVVPTQDGNLLLEWQTAGMPSVDIDLATAFHAFDERGGDIERDFHLADAKGMGDFFTFLSAHVLECEA